MEGGLEPGVVRITSSFAARFPASSFGQVVPPPPPPAKGGSELALPAWGWAGGVWCGGAAGVTSHPSEQGGEVVVWVCK